ncbi:hypothetical protein GT019_04220 [Paenibacillus sp. T1]|uniref:Integrase catalytic domain-containing protein n=1 Tax=Paenibacillus glycinis TaxID=2697035 RepID=A0ABW9XKC7_9BACL|nr:hypothetical protein [Paenibacillus glycinis]
MIQSMSRRVGRCIDNGPMESFWGTLKCEKYYLHTYLTFEELERDIQAYHIIDEVLTDHRNGV